MDSANVVKQTSATAFRNRAKLAQPQKTDGRFPRRVGAWHLEHLLAKGRSADVFLARPAGSDASSPTDFVVKMLTKDAEANPEERARFRQEAISGRRISHPNLVPVLSAELDQSPYHFVMPYLAGTAVNEILRHHGKLVVPHAIWIARQVADALAALHAGAWRHGDVQPGNIVVSRSGHATLIDLGCMSRAYLYNSLERPSLTGNLNYLAPEQLTRCGGIDGASDVYALGILLYEMLAGRRPFPEAEPGRTIESHLRDIPPSIRTWIPEAPRCLAQCLARMLAKHPQRRPATTGELQAILARLEVETFDLRQPRTSS
jgi:serine/threonine-protein kinase